MASFPETAHFPAHDNRTKGISVEEHAEDSGLSARVEKLNINVLTVVALLTFSVGGAVSVGILYEQNRNTNAQVTEMRKALDDVRIWASAYTQNHEALKSQIIDLKAEIADLKRNRT